MRIGIISDIHGNLPALDAVLEDAQPRALDALYCELPDVFATDLERGGAPITALR